MSSLLPGFEYDIFISYRHNDNLDGWVTDFVLNLEKELRSTIKDPVSIYFDTNPHDGLLETHDIDRSLERKLKCMIFIPIISQTYCDPRSFAWTHELCVFNKSIQDDQFGVDITLGNGNVCSRILPVQIHSLDAEDKQHIENELKRTYRPIEFIFKEPGVNRPLRLMDSKNENQNRTDYRNQINKLANTTKEITSAMLGKKRTGLETTDTGTTYTSGQQKRQTNIKASQGRKQRLKQFTLGITLGICLAGSLFYFFVFYGKAVSIAIMPITDVEGNMSLDYQLDVLTDELISSLSKVPDLDVRPTSSVLRFQAGANNLSAIANSLNVNSILSIRAIQNEGVNAIITELVEVDQFRVLWKKRYDQGLIDVPMIKEDIIIGVTETLRPNLSNKEKNKIVIDRLYENGRYYWNKRTVEGLTKAIEYFNQIIQRNENYAPAYAGLADSYLLLTYYGSATSYNDNFIKAKEYAVKALEIDNNLPEAHTSLAMCLFEFDFDLEKADIEFKKAIDLNPEYGTALQWYGELLTAQGKFPEAISRMKQAEEIDPLSRIIKADYGLMCYYARDFNCAIQQYEKTLSLDPDFAAAHWWLGETYTVLGEYDKAIASYKTALANSTKSTRIMACLAYTYAVAGNKTEAINILNQMLESASHGGYVSPYEFALIYTGMHDLDKAFAQLNSALEAHVYDLIFLNVEPLMDPLRSDPRFKQLVAKIL